LPIALSAPCVDITKIYVARQMNAATRRVPFQKKIGAGLSKDEFREAIRSREISGHVGLSQSIAMLADSIGWELEQIEVKTPEPILLESEVASDWISIHPGMVAGTKQQAFGKIGGKNAILYDFAAYIGAPEEFDAVEISGTPKISFKSSPCINGDSGTIAMLINTIPLVLDAAPGLLTMKDLKLPRAANMPKPNIQDSTS
jgi:2,4-diaminopentanoate dehydrogenase